MQYATTSPFYPLFASLDINAKMQEGALGRKMWESCLKTSISARKKIAKYCSLIKPFIPEKVNGKNWEKAATENIMSNIDYWKFRPEEKWHGFSEYEKEQYFIDPFKLILTTPGINTENDTYLDFGIPAAVLTCFLKEHGIIAEKNNLNSILFLMTPAEDEIKIDNLITRLLQFEHYIHTDAPLEEVLPELYSHYAERYNGYTIKQLCQEMHDMYKFHDSKELQKFLFLKAHFPVQNMSPKAANIAFKKGHSKLVKVSEIKGETALEGALPYPPGIFCVVPGEVWNEHAQSYFLALEECINRFPGLAPEIQGVYFEQHHNHIAAFAYVYDKQTFT